MHVTTASLAELAAYYRPGASPLRWPHPFSLPGWMAAWWQVFGAGYAPLILVFQEGDEVIGLAPLKRQGETASFIGDASVCDYLDFITVPGREQAFAAALLAALARRGLKLLEMETLRPEAVASRYVTATALRDERRVLCRQVDVSYELPLPASWEDYLALLEPKQRHEVERKLRRLERVGEARFTVLADAAIGAPERAAFFGFMAESRRDKAGFLTADMRRFFELAMEALAGDGLLRLGFLSLGAQRVAAVLFFLYNNNVYLYNSGYDPAYREVSAGLISKLYCLRWAIERKLAVFDFLKGSEVYKQHLGGRRVSLSGCQIDLKEGHA